MKIFKDRKAAGRILVRHLKNIKADIILGIPRGGVVVAAEIAKALNLPLDIIVTRKIGVPDQPEMALGALDPDGEVVWEQELINDLGEEIQIQWKELKRREDEYRVGKEPLNVDGKTVILVDDGIATGATALSAIKYLKRHGVKELILAVPVASQEAFEKLKKEVDEMVVLNIPQFMGAVGQFYQEFLPVSDQEVIRTLTS